MSRLNVQLGCFGNTKNIEQIAVAGYSEIEMQYSDIVDMGTSAFARFIKQLHDADLHTSVMDNPLPKQAVIASSDFDLAWCRKYIRLGAERAAELGVKFCNFGNGKARSFDPTQLHERAKVLEVLAICCEENRQYGIDVLLEPLSDLITNFVFSTEEALAVGKELGVSNLKTFVDLRWYWQRNHSYDNLLKNGAYIQHVHIDNPLSPFPVRLIPRRSDPFDYEAFFAALKQIDYSGIIACEANTFDSFEKEIGEAFKFLEELVA